MRSMILVLFLLSIVSCKKDTLPHEIEAERSQIRILPYIHLDAMEPTLINGEVVDREKYKEVVSIITGNSGCTATLVGPKVVITAAHCVTNGATSQFTLAGSGVTHKGRATRSPLYPRKDHDVALILLSDEVEGVSFSTIGGRALKGDKLTIFGYGCTRPGGSGGNDGKLRMGHATITGFSGYDMVSGEGAALCFGDSGGPAYLSNAQGRTYLLGINSKGDIRSTNYNTRLDTPESQKFLKDFAETHKVEICGVNKDCSVTPPPPQEDEITAPYEFKDLSLLIPDNDRSGIELSFDVKQPGTLLDLALEYKIEHTHPRDLIIDLVSPSGEYVRVFQRVNVQGKVIHEKLGMGGTPVNFAIFDVTQVQGTWKLLIRDLGPDDEGKLLYAKLVLKTLIK